MMKTKSGAAKRFRVAEAARSSVTRRASATSSPSVQPRTSGSFAAHRVDSTNLGHVKAMLPYA
jgi:ribosomal protein L35